MALTAQYERDQSTQKGVIAVRGFEYLGLRASAWVALAQEGIEMTAERMLTTTPRSRNDRTSPHRSALQISEALHNQGAKVYAVYCDEAGNIMPDTFQMVSNVFCGHYEIRYRIKRTAISPELHHVQMKLFSSTRIRPNLLHYSVDGRDYTLKSAIDEKVWTALAGFEIPVGAVIKFSLGDQLDETNYRFIDDLN